MAAYQICVRCENRWPVTYQPRQWCPSCRGVLLSPVSTDVPVPPSRRNFRWVARPAVPIGPAEPTMRKRGTGPTPRYREIPRWGLTDPRPVDTEYEPSRSETLSDLAPTLLVGAAVVFGLAALAEALRYGLLVFNRTRLVDPLALAVSDAAVWATQVGAPFVALGAAVACAVRLLELRRCVFAERGEVDPRPSPTVLLGVVVPGVNLAMPGVLLTEIAGRDPRLLRAIRIWWVLWVLDAVMFVVVVLWRQRDTLQARADGVLLAAFAAALATAVALTTLHVVRLFEGTDIWGRPLRHRRFTYATGPAYAPIAPIVPRAATAGGPADTASPAQDDTPAGTQDEHADVPEPAAST